MKVQILAFLLLSALLAVNSASVPLDTSDNYEPNTYELIENKDDKDSLVYVQKDYPLEEIVLLEEDTADIDEPSELKRIRVCVAFRCKISIFKVKICICIRFRSAIDADKQHALPNLSI